MGLLSAVLETRTRVIDGLDPKDPAIARFFAPPETVSGVRVDANRALTISGMFRAVDLIAGTIASLPLPVFRKLPSGKKALPEDRRHTLLNIRPNPEMSAVSMRETWQSHPLVWGNGYAEIKGDADEVWPLPPDKTKPFRDQSKKLWYRTLDDSGKPRILRPEEVLHLPGLGSGGVLGYVIADLARESLGAAIAVQQFAAAFFGNSSMPAGILTLDQAVGPKAMEERKEEWEENYGAKGGRAGWKTAILNPGVTWQAMGLNPEDAQLLETKVFDIQEVARWTGVPPPLLFDLSHGTLTNVRELINVFERFGLRRWLVKQEQELNWKLFPHDGSLFVKHDLDDLLRADLAERTKAKVQQFQNGALTINEWLSDEDRNKIDPELGDQRFIPLNLGKLEDVISGKAAADAAPPPPEPPPDDDDEDDESDEGADEDDDDEVDERAATFRGLFADGLGRVLGKESKATTRALDKHTDVGEYDQWFTGWSVKHRDTVVSTMRPVVECVASACGGARRDFIEGYLEAMAERHTGDRAIEPDVAKLAAAEAERAVAAFTESSDG